MAANINSELEKAGFKNLGITERPNLVVLKRTKMPAVLVEASFINNDKDNETFDKNFNQIANGIADGILKTLGIKPKTNNTTAPVSYTHLAPITVGIPDTFVPSGFTVSTNGIPAIIARISDTAIIAKKG